MILKYKFFIVITIFAFLMPLNANVIQAQTDSVEWHPIMTSGTILRYQVIQSIVTNMTNPPEFLGEELSMFDDLEISFNQNPPLEFSELYNNEVPTWLTFKLNSVELSLVGLSPQEIEYLHFFIFPLFIHWANGTSSTTSEFFQSFHPTYVSSVDPVIEGSTSITFQYEDHNIFLPVNSNNGVALTFYYGNPATGVYELTLQNEMELTTTTPSYTEPPEEEYDGPTTIAWADSIKKDTILSWKVTEYQEGDGDLTIGGTIIKLGDILQVGYIKNPPTDAEKLFAPQGPPDWLDLYINSNQIDFDAINGEGQMLLFLTLPLTYTFDNGSVYTLEDFLNAFFDDQDHFTNFNIQDDGDSWTVYWEEHDSDGSDTSIYNVTWIKSTGVVQRLYMDFPEGTFLWTYFEEAANVDEDGVTKTIDESYSVELDYPALAPGFEIFPLLFVLLIGVVVRKRIRN